MRYEDESEEITIPEGFFNEEKYIKIERIFVCETFLQVIEYLKEYITDDNENDYFDLVLRMKHDFKDPDSKDYRTKTIAQKKLGELIDYLEEYIATMEESYGDDRENEDIIGDMFLKRINPWYGSGEASTMFKIINNTPVTIIFEKTKDKCFIKAVLASIGKSPLCNEIRSYNKYYRDLSFEDLKKALELKHNIRILITSSMKKLEQYFVNKNDNDVLLFSYNKHIGRVVIGIPELELEPAKVNEMKLPDKKDIIVGCFDVEFEWTKRDGVFVSSDPNLVCFVYTYHGITYEKKYPNMKAFMISINAICQARDCDMYIYSHNGQKIEHRFVVKERLNMYLKKGKTPDIVLENIAGNKIKSYNWKLGKNTIRFIDTTLYMKMTLEDLAICFKTQESKGHAHLSKDATAEEKNAFYEKKKWNINDPNDVEYCMNDCKVLLEVVTKLEKMIAKVFGFPQDSWCLSKPSISAIDKAYIFSQYPEIVNTNTQAVTFSEAYTGGRTEIFYRGKVNVPKGHEIRGIDISSSYPYEMIKGVPGKYLGTLKSIPVTSIPGKRWLMLCRLSYIKDYAIPPLAVKNDFKLIFPNIRTPRLMFLFDFEYYTLKDNLKIDEVLEIYSFAEIKFDIVAKLYKMKQDADKESSLYTALKVFINGCYGSLALNLLRPFKKVVSQKDLTNSYEEYYTDDINDEFTWLQAKHLIKTNVCYQAAAAITAQARMHLWSKIDELMNKKYKILYCDTDSVYFVCPISVSKEESKGLGGWDEKHHKSMTIFTCKIYILDGKLYMKGFKNKNRENSITDIEDALENGFDYINDEWVLIKNDGTIELKKIKKHAKLTYDKAIVKDDGNVVPLTI